MWDKYPRDERRNGSLFLSCSVVFIATVRDGKCFRSKSLVKCVIEKIMHPRTREQQEGNLYVHASTYGLKIVPHSIFCELFTFTTNICGVECCILGENLAFLPKLS